MLLTELKKCVPLVWARGARAPTCAWDVSESAGLPKLTRLPSFMLRTRMLMLFVLVTVPLHVDVVVLTLLVKLPGARMWVGLRCSGLAMARWTILVQDLGRLVGRLMHLLRVNVDVCDRLSALVVIRLVSVVHRVSGDDFAVMLSMVPGLMLRMMWVIPDVVSWVILLGLG